jgi:hypothetical protein
VPEKSKKEIITVVDHFTYVGRRYSLNNLNKVSFSKTHKIAILTTLIIRPSSGSIALGVFILHIVNNRLFIRLPVAVHAFI